MAATVRTLTGTAGWGRLTSDASSFIWNPLMRALAQRLEPPCATRCWVRSAAAETQVGPLWNVSIIGSGFTCFTTTLTP